MGRRVLWATSLDIVLGLVSRWLRVAEFLGLGVLGSWN